LHDRDRWAGGAYGAELPSVNQEVSRGVASRSNRARRCGRLPTTRAIGYAGGLNSYGLGNARGRGTRLIARRCPGAKEGDMTSAGTGKMRAAVLGSGNIGTDLAIKLAKSAHLECAALIGRSLNSAGLSRAQAEGIPVSAAGVDHILSAPGQFDIVFDATSAAAHHQHAPDLEAAGMLVIDLTPAKRGAFCVPSVNLEQSLGGNNVNMVTCGGQASSPIAHALGSTHQHVDYIEVVSSIASRSAGPATRANLDEYIHTTEAAIRSFSGANRAKAILNLNPAVPCINMQTTVYALVREPQLEAFTAKLRDVVAGIQRYIPGYEVLVWPRMDDGRVVTMVRVTGRGDYLPSYAGNLDIINCAAIAVAEEYAVRQARSTQAHGLRVVR
jgi:acetaldehyde dehydrogenase (acetylating)